jgi:hypothetical protein
VSAEEKQLIFFGIMAGVGWGLFVRGKRAEAAKDIGAPPLVPAPREDETDDRRLTGVETVVSADVAQAVDVTGSGYVGAGAAAGAYKALEEAGMNAYDESYSRLI